MSVTIKPHLMFEGKAEAALQLYVSLFPEAELLEMQHYKAGEQGAEGTVKLARFSIQGREFQAIDSPISHEFTFTPSLSLFAEFDDEGEFDTVYQALSHEAEMLMPRDQYGFSREFCWLNDRFGVSWQLSLK